VDETFDDTAIAFVERVAKSFEAPPLKDLIAREQSGRPASATKHATVH
jgi:hypothetical protein